MAKAYIIGEASETVPDPMSGDPMYLLVPPVHWNSEFEEWYAQVDHVILDDDGRRSRLAWDADVGFKLIFIDQTNENRVRFLEWLRKWISLSDSDSHLMLDRRAGQDQVEAVLNDPEYLRKIAR